MAEPDEAPFSLLSLEEDLTCSICLSTFDCPVTIPCGHNFCHDCLLNSWKDSYSCPQCRTLFATRPELKKNTVLSTVVETFRGRSTVSDELPEESEPTEKDVICCDTCMEAEAAQTCLTCMASFCEEHLRPHRENPTFRLHQLSQPVGDLSEHICSEHHKLMEHFCTQHLRLICSLCLQQVHKGCSFTSPEEQRSLKQTEFREKLCFLDVKIEKTDSVVLQMNELQIKLKDAAEKRKAAIGAVYQQMREMLDQDERVARHEVDCELEAGQAKLRDFARRFTENSERMQRGREEISHLMSQSQTRAFLQASFELPKVVKFDPHAPRVSLDSKRVTAAQTFAAALQENLVQILSEPFESRMPLIKPELNTAAPDKTEAPFSGPVTFENVASQPESSSLRPAEEGFRSRSKSPGHPPVRPFIQTIPIPVYIQSQPTWATPPFAQGQGFPRGAQFFTGHQTKQDKRPQSAQGRHKPDGKGADSAKKDKPKNHPPSEKSAGHNPHPKDKKSDGGHHPPNKQDKRPQSAQGHKPDGKGADSAKKDKPKNHPPSEKSAGHKPHPKGNPHPKNNPHPKKNK